MPAGDLITAALQVEWRGVLWGWPATSVGITDLSGWLDLPALRGSNANRPGRHGAWPGQKRAGERVIEVELTAIDDDPAALATIRDATTLGEDPAEEELVIWAGTDDPQWVMARLERRAMPTDFDWSVGHHRALLQWVATDPRRYSVISSAQPIGLPTAGSGGLAFPLAFPLDFGSGPSGGGATITNAGNASTWPLFTLTGPLSGPTILNIGTGQRLRFASTFTLALGETMLIDTDARAVTIAGVGRRDALLSADWFPLPPGDTSLAFTSGGAYDAAAGLTVSWRHAYL